MNQGEAPREDQYTASMAMCKAISALLLESTELLLRIREEVGFLPAEWLSILEKATSQSHSREETGRDQSPIRERQPK